MNQLKNAITIDVEDYYQVEAFSSIVDRNKWEDFESRVEKNNDEILQLFADQNVKGTFFVLGWVAQRYPQIVKRIAEQGHEVASHGMSHRLIYTQDPDTFRQETRDSKALLEDLVQKPVIGYRAATYSITNKNLWALDILAEEGFLYDSSIFPMAHDRYGIPDANPVPHKLTTPKGYALTEFPITVCRMGPVKLPIAGGGYFRLFPYWLTKMGLSEVNRQGEGFVFYLHPWEVDPEQPRFQNASALSKFRHYLNLHRCRDRLKSLLTDFEMTTMEDVLSHKGLLAAA